MALTTTIGLCARRFLTMAATRSMACASSTEVPPNFITIIGVDSWEGCGRAVLSSFRGTGVQIAPGFEQFGIQHGCAGGAADGVVREHRELPLQDSAGAQTADGRSHARSQVDIEPRLRTVTRLQINDWTLGSAGQLQFLRFASVVGPTCNDFL